MTNKEARQAAGIDAASAAHAGSADPERKSASPGSTTDRSTRRRRRGLASALLAPISVLAAVFGKLVSVLTRSSNELGSATTLGHEAASGMATTAAATGTNAAGTAGAGATTAAAPGAGGAGTGAAGATPPPAQGSIAQAAGIGAAATATVATVVAVMALTGSSEPETAEPPAAPVTVATTTPEPEPPASGPGVFTADAAGPLSDNLLSEATGGTSANPLAVAAVGGSPANVGTPVVLASGATVTVAADGSFRYEPNSAFESLGSGETATDVFDYTVTDGAGWTAGWTATVTVSGVNDPPNLAEAGPLSLGEGTAGSLTLTASDPDPDQLTFVLSDSAPAFVTLVDASDGTATITATPGPGDAGRHQVSVTVTDDGDPPSSATVTVSLEVTELLARVTAGLLALYEFESGSGETIADTSGVGEPLDLVVTDAAAMVWTDGSIELRSPTLVRSAGPATKIVDSVIAANEVTIEAWVTPATTTQGGPARIVSISDGTVERNVT
ncbi:MAG: Ig-like domain-containing protein, partial [Acidimicrobiia bacterium]|nr:Ig-like domain-containing protein [Acidimicrobiia bacterium]